MHLGIPFDQSRFMSLALPQYRTILNVLPASYIQYLQMILGTLDISISLQRQPHHRDYQELFSGPITVKTKVGFLISNPDEDTQSWSDDSSSESGGSRDRSHNGEGDSGNGRFQQGPSTQQSQRNGSQVTHLQLSNVLKKTLEAGTALHVFALTRFKFVVECLVSFVPLKAKLTNGATPLHFAALSAPRDVFELLLSSPDSADAIRMRDNDWNTPLNIAQQLRRRNIVNLILRRFPGMNVELVEDLFFSIGQHFDFPTARLFTLTCKSAYEGLLYPTDLLGLVSSPKSSGKVYYLRASADAPVARTLRLVNDLLLKNQVVYLHLDEDESRYIPSVLATQWGKALLSNERLQALNISTIGREAGQERHLWTRAFAKATAATISLKTGELPTGLSASVMAQLSELRLTYVTPKNGPNTFVRTFAGLKKLHLDGSFDPAWLLSVMQHPRLESLSLIWEEIPTSSFGPCLSILNLKSLAIEADEETINYFASLIPHLQNLTALTLMSRATLDSAFLQLTSLRSLSLDGWIGLGSSYSLRDWISKSTRLETLNLRIDDMEQPESSPEDFAFDFGAVKNLYLIVQLFSWCSISASLRTATRLEHLTLIGNETTDSASEVTAALRQLSTLKTVTKSLGPDSARPHQTIVMHRAFTFENEALSIDDVLLTLREDSTLLHLRTLHAELTQDDVPKAIELVEENSSTLREVRLNCSEVDSDFSGPILPTPPHQLSVLQSLELRFPPIRSLLEHRAWDSLPCLRHLDASVRSDETIELQHLFFESLSSLQNLSSFSLGVELPESMEVRGSLPASFGHHLSRLAQLDTIVIQNIDFETDEAIAAFGSALKSLGLLRRVDVAFSNIGENVSLITKPLIEIPNLESISLRATSLEDGDLSAILELIPHESLEQIDLQQNLITDEGANKLVAALSGRKHLWSLNLRHNEISSRRISKLSTLTEQIGVSFGVSTGDHTSDSWM